jgi:hypothetical protein
MQPYPPVQGRWYFIPDQQPKPVRDTRLCRNAWEWALFLGCWVALMLATFWFTGSGLDALIGTLVCLSMAALLSLF